MKTNQDIEQILHKDELIKLDEAYKKERRSERLITQLKNDVLGANLSNNSFFFARERGPFKARYLTSKEQLENRLTIEPDGKFIHHNGNPAHGRYIYIVKENFEIIAAHYDEKIHHSYLANGKKVRGAGFIEFENGILNTIDNDSGHYKPTTRQMMTLLSRINETIPNKVIFKDFSNLAEGYVFKYRIDELIMCCNNDELEALKGSTEKEEYRMMKCARSTIQDRYQKVKEIEKELRASLMDRLNVKDEELEEAGYELVVCT